MAESVRDRLIKKSPWQILLLAVVILVVGQSLLVWQYRRLEGERMRELEQRQATVEQQMEERAAQGALREFLEARVAGDEVRASRYITEQAALQRQQRVSEFFGVQNYEIQEKEKLEEGSFRFRVELMRDRLKQIELIELLKIGENYYVNSVQLAG